MFQIQSRLFAIPNLLVRTLNVLSAGNGIRAHLLSLRHFVTYDDTIRLMKRDWLKCCTFYHSTWTTFPTSVVTLDSKQYISVYQRKELHFLEFS